MESRVKVFGHPLHPMLIVFPLGLLATAAIFDIIGLLGGGVHWHTMAYYLIAAGIIGGLLAAVPGAVDWWVMPRATRAKRVGLLHGVGNVIVVALFLVSWLLRRPEPAFPPATAYVVSFAGFLLAGVTGWLGGELVDRLGVGVDPGAHLNSPSSLSNRPATAYEGPDRRRHAEPYTGLDRRMAHTH
ncbi:MAG TPA: DUF2231 domain-containing protein [Gemmatimonadales bacterium]|nr:DUF2231 domain-containing protein [Gemmatimonadales bacterium]